MIVSRRLSGANRLERTANASSEELKHIMAGGGVLAWR
jgi:hypothetical protein